MKSFHDLERYACHCCDHTFTSVYTLKTHLVDIHGRNEQLETLKSSKFINEEIIPTKPSKQTYKPTKAECPKCGMEFANVSNRNKHMKRHMENGKYIS